MNAEDPKSIAIRSVEIMASGDRTDFDAVYHPDAVNDEAVSEPPECRGRGPEAIWAVAQWLRSAFSDLHFECPTAIVEGDVVALHVTMSGRHTGPFVTYTPEGRVETAMPPTGKSFAVTQSHWLRIADGKVIRHWANRDDLGMAKQAGWVPPTPLYLLKMARAKSRAKRNL